MYTDEEQAYYNKGVQMGQLSTIPTAVMINPLLAPKAQQELIIKEQVEILTGMFFQK
jgi:hypothetical protein